jgi:uncharacterized protein
VAERVLIDTGPIVAIFSEGDVNHQRCGDALAALSPPLFTCWPVVTEAAWLLRKRPDALNKLFESFHGGFLTLLALDAGDLPAIAGIMNRYESLGLQLADAALAHLADREKVRKLFTTDRRDFSVIRLKRGRALELIPDI